MPEALVIGGTGLVGRAVARRLLADGWTVSVTGRDPGHLPSDVAKAGARFVAANRDDAEALAAAVQRPEVEYAVSIGPGDGAAEVYFSDLGYEYIRINAEYTT